MASRRDRPWCSAIASLICRPTVSSGLSEVIGSWKIIEMSLPRMRSISVSVSSSRLLPSKRIAPPTMRPGGLATRRRMDSAVTLLPQPELAHHAQRLAAAHGIGDAVDRPHDADRGEEMRLEILDLQDRLRSASRPAATPAPAIRCRLIQASDSHDFVVLACAQRNEQPAIRAQPCSVLKRPNGRRSAI